MANIYLLSITYNSQSHSTSSSASLFGNASVGGQITVRAGYLGICAKTANDNPWICASGASGLGLSLAGDGKDPLNAIGWAGHFKSDVVFSGLIFGAIALSALAFMGLATFPGWHEEHNHETGSDINIKPFPSRPVSQGVLFLLCAASLFLGTSALWQHVAAASAASMIDSGSQGFLSGHVGPAAAGLVWLTLALVGVAAIAILVMVMSIRLLDRLTDE